MTKADVQAIRSDLQGLVSEGLDLDEALEEAIQANMPVTVTPSELCAMYHTLDEVPDTTPHLMYGRQTKPEARAATKALIKRHLEALAEFDEEELEAALVDGDRQAAIEDEDDLSVQGNEEGSVAMSVGSVQGAESDNDEEEEVEDLIVRGRKYRQALTGAKVHDAGVQGNMGGKLWGLGKPGKKTGTLGEAVGRWKVLSPMVDSLDVKPHLRDLLLNHAVMAAYEAGDPVLVPKDTVIKPVSVSRMMAERAVLEAGEMRKPQKV